MTCNNDYESHIMANMNDSRNMGVIFKENQDLKEFIPKTAPQKVVVAQPTENIEDVVNNIYKLDYSTFNILDILKNQNIVATYLVNKFKFFFVVFSYKSTIFYTRYEQ